jgi:hypothetical protein
VANNTGGGVSLTGTQFEIVNSYIVENGRPGGSGSLLGGLVIRDIADSGTHRVEFNTIAGNFAKTGIVAGVSCTVVTVPLSFGNNVVYGNGTDSLIQVEGGNCNWTYSSIGTGVVPGTGNIAGDPQFVDAGQSNYRLKGTSPARDAADPGATVGVDHEGDKRPQGSRRDMGADEVR